MIDNHFAKSFENKYSLGSNELITENEPQLSSSQVNDSRSGSKYIPSTFEIVYPLIPESQESKDYMNQAHLTSSDNILSHASPQQFPRQISLHHTLKGNQNYSIVIVEPNSSMKKNPIKIDEHVLDTSDFIHKSFSNREDFDLEFNNGNNKIKSNGSGNQGRMRSRTNSIIRISHINVEDNYDDHDYNEVVVVSNDIVVNNETGIGIKFNNGDIDNDNDNDNYNYNNINIDKDNVNKYQKKNIKIQGVGESKNFNFGNTQVRRYLRTDLIKAKSYFKYRYLSEKLLEINNLVEMKLGKSVNMLNSSTNLNNQLTYQQNINEKRDSVKENNIYYSADDKNVIKFTCLFLQKMEKTIFLFNMKKYEDSFNYLKENSIIKNEEEFGEILLIFPGFDKFIIGEFLSKEKNPNLNFVILNHFINKMEFTDQSFLNSFRYLLYRMNLPKDSALILNIIDVFSSVFFKDNCERERVNNNNNNEEENKNNIIFKSQFKDVTSVYLLASTILALNTMFHCKIPNANIQMMKKIQFVKMNENVDESLSGVIYDEIKENKLDIIYDYNEQIYKKLEFEDVLGKTGKKDTHVLNSFPNQISNDKNDKFSNNNLTKNDLHILNSDRSTIVNGEELIDMLKAGSQFIKYGKSGEPHDRLVYLSADETNLIWKPLTCGCFNSERRLKTKNLVNIYIGTSNSQIFDRYKIRPEFELNCLSILSTKRTLDLRHEDQKLVKKWMQAIKYLVKRVISKFEVKKQQLKELINRKEIISDFWRTEILPKWTEYRQFLLIKGKSNTHIFSNNEIYKRNFKNVLKEKSEKKTKSKLVIEDKDKQDVAYLWFLGIPDWLRKKLWSLVISNDLDINENLFNFYLRKNEHIEFHGETVVDRLSIQDTTPGFNQTVRVLGRLDGIDIIEDNKIINTRYDNITDPLLNEIILDVHKCYKKFEEYIKTENIEEKKFKEDLFKTLRIFTNYRPDITYSRQIAYITTIFYLNSEDYYQSFVLSANFIIPSFLTKFLNKDEIFIKTRCEFFETIISNYTPLVLKHFKNLDISIMLFFYDWVEFLFTKTFKYETLLRLFDCFLVKGEIFIYEVALSIIKLQEKDLVNSTVKKILQNLSYFPDKYTEDDLFSVIEKIDINDEYRLLTEQNELAKEKTLLYSAFLYY